MPYARWDDKFHRHPKRLLLSASADGMSLRASSYIAEHLTDGFVPEAWLDSQIAQHAGALNLSPRAATKERARLLEEITKPLPPRGNPVFERTDGGYMLHDYLEHNQTAEEIEVMRATGRAKDAKTRAFHRDKDTVRGVRTRDADHCRYCNRQVNWQDRRGPGGATYDHVIPGGPNTLENVVVACRSCNSAKRNRTPAEANMPLLPPLGAQMDLDPNQIQTHPRVSGSGEVQETTKESAADTPAGAPDNPLPLTDTGTPTDEVLQVLSKCSRLRLDDVNARIAIEGAVQSQGGWGQCDPVAAAHEAVALAADPTWNLTNPGGLMLHVLRKQKQQPARPARPEADDDRRARLHAEADRLEAEEAAQR